MKKYEKYKHSGVEWIGEVPEHWEVKKLKRLGKICNGQDHKNVWDDNGAFPIIGSGGEFGRANSFIYDKPSVILGRKGTIDRPQFIEVPFWTVDTAYYVDIYNETYPKFLYLLCLTIKFDLYKYGSAVPSMTQEVLSQIPFAVPSKQEQEIISLYLTRKTAEIDSLIAKKTQLIELYEAEKTAIINQAVTKGLDPTAKMKDSGVEWIGEVPEGWEVKRLKYVAKILRGKFSHRPRNDEKLYSGAYPFIQTGDVARAQKYVETYNQTLNDEGYKVTTEFPKGTLLMTIAANIGDIAILGFDACFPDSIVGFYPVKEIGNEFLYYKLKSMIQVFLSTAVSNTQMNLNIDRISGLPIVYPQLFEQISIIAHIEKKTTELDTLISQTHSLIELLKEYRATLISEVVTGKVKIA